MSCRSLPPLKEFYPGIQFALAAGVVSVKGCGAHIQTSTQSFLERLPEARCKSAISVSDDKEWHSMDHFFQNQQLQTRLSDMEKREGTWIAYMSWMEEHLAVLEKKLTGPPTGPQ
ncbi:hypothetical protein Tco_0974723 [Tanacetum coccineum]|uniref:Uncharacterized protein n=1 Tax=Tanacetum coccineum TaxID=301880 RepID=A0ABQ5ECJ6_9ASTR